MNDKRSHLIRHLGGRNNCRTNSLCHFKWLSRVLSRMGLQMQIRYGFDIALDLAQPTTVLTMMDVHSDVRSGVVEESALEMSPIVPAQRFVDDHGNVVRRLFAPAGVTSLRLDGVFHCDGSKDEVDASAEIVPVSNLPPHTLQFLRPSRYCETELLSDLAWANFGALAGGWARVQAICDFVHRRLRFSYPEARPTRTASEALAAGVGVCRDFTHLAVTLCRCLNIPARYCNGYLGDIGVPPDPAPMDFNAWFEVFLGGRWFTFDARHNQPRIGRILIARGRDAADIPMIATFGSHWLTCFTVFTEEIKEPASIAA
jgi:transglutaminase-like putative cysteine protease